MSQALVHDKDATEMGPGETVDSVGGQCVGKLRKCGERYCMEVELTLTIDDSLLTSC